MKKPKMITFYLRICLAICFTHHLLLTTNQLQVQATPRYQQDEEHVKRIDVLFNQLETKLSSDYRNKALRRKIYKIKRKRRVDMRDPIKLFDKVAIVELTFSGNLSTEVKQYVIEMIHQMNRSKVLFQLFLCNECLQPRVNVDPTNKFYLVKKGITEQDDYLRIAEKLNVNYVANFNLIYNHRRWELSLVVMDATTQKTVWSEIFEVYQPYMLANSEFSSHLKLTLAAGLDMTPMLQIGLGENISFKRTVGLGIDFATSSTSVESYVALGPYLHLNLNNIFGWYKTQTQYELVTKLAYGAFNGELNLVPSLGTDIYFGEHFLLSLLTSVGVPFNLFSSDEEEEEVTASGEQTYQSVMPFAINLGMGVRF
jgi:hypothetical protein